MEPMYESEPLRSQPESDDESSSGSRSGGSKGGRRANELGALITYLVHELAEFGEDESIEETERMEFHRNFAISEVSIRCWLRGDAYFTTILPIVARPPGVKCECCDGTGITPTDRDKRP